MTAGSATVALAGRRIAARDLAELRDRNGRIVSWSLAAYGLLLVVLAVVNDVRPTPVSVGIAVVLALIASLRGASAVRDWLPLLAIALAYELIRPFSPMAIANVHVSDVIALERSIFGGQLATQLLQSTFRPHGGPDPLAIVATLVYALHTILPIAVGAYLWFRHRRVFYDFMAAMLLLSIGAFVLYLLVPVAPPWWAAAHGYLVGPEGSPLIAYLKPPAIENLAASAGADGRAIFGLIFDQVSPDQVAAFPSLHAAYPFLAFLFARRVLGRGRWAVLVYAAIAWFSIVYLGDHYVVDVVTGVTAAIVAYLAVVEGPRWRSAVARLAGSAFSVVQPEAMREDSPS